MSENIVTRDSYTELYQKKAGRILLQRYVRRIRTYRVILFQHLMHLLHFLGADGFSHELAIIRHEEFRTRFPTSTVPEWLVSGKGILYVEELKWDACKEINKLCPLTSTIYLKQTRIKTETRKTEMVTHSTSRQQKLSLMFRSANIGEKQMKPHYKLHPEGFHVTLK